ERWSKCANHHVNITLNGKPLPKWLSGDLGRTDTQLTMPITRGTGDQTRWCQHVLRLAGNLVIDVEACAPKAGITAAAELTDKIEAGIH
ncbi:MAG: sensor domain-containing protein, partial [Mycobacterium sp.]